MQQSVRQPEEQGRGKSRGIIAVAVLLFALSGLLAGFAAGASTRHSTAQTQPPSSSNHPQPIQKTGVTPTATSTFNFLQVGVGCPKFPALTYQETADNTTSYKAQIQAYDKSDTADKSPCGKGKALTEPGLTCKLWLAKDADTLKKLSSTDLDKLKNVNELSRPFNGEIVGGLLIDDNQSTKACDQNGMATWNYKLSSSLDPGNYYVAALVDWQGTLYNWTWIIIKVTH